MGRTIGIVIAAGLLSAVYQVAQDESRDLLARLRLARRFRDHRNEIILVSIAGSDLEYGLQQLLLRARDATRMALFMMTQPGLTREDHEILQQAVVRSVSANQ